MAKASASHDWYKPMTSHDSFGSNFGVIRPMSNITARSKSSGRRPIIAYAANAPQSCATSVILRPGAALSTVASARSTTSSCEYPKNLASLPVPGQRAFCS